MSLSTSSLTATLFCLLCTASSCRSLQPELEDDTDTGAPCGEVDQPCCQFEADCLDTLVCVTGVNELTPDDPYCLEQCAPSVCTNVTGNDGICSDIGLPGGHGACLTDEDYDPVDCVEGTYDCTTPSGTSEETICLTGGGNNYCFETCMIVEDTCAEEHTCVPTTDGGGACLPD